MRLSELINLQLTDVKSDSDLLLIQQSKGNKDRLVALPDKLLILLREYYIAYKPKVFLFEGANNTKYSERSIQLVLKKAMKKAQNNNLHQIKNDLSFFTSVKPLQFP